MAKCKNCKNLKYKDDGRERYAWCPLVGDNPNLEFDRYCGGYKTMSQGDRIRSMTDEELAEWLNGFSECLIPNDDCLDKYCNNCVLKWIKSEVGCE